MRFHLDPDVRAAWLTGDTRVAAQAVSQVPAAARTRWACGLATAALPAVVDAGELRAAVERAGLLDDVDDPRAARTLFETVRRHRLSLTPPDRDPDAGTQSSDELVLALAELTCKVVHDEATAGAAFDPDSDLRLVHSAAALARRLPHLEHALWLAVCRRAP
ncbi:hypothetical protein AB6N24_15860 [Cellulomonas sp. 179-A 4D5 NHS]|uniref:hypothetical protein n=1 Tax=Cellulomonas sp. 179-A 4D5 NHS TaxID=3142378 RepID=UPI0039A17A06